MIGDKPIRNGCRSRILRLLIPVALVALVPMGLLVGCQSKLIYFPRPYPVGAAAEWREKTSGKTVDFQTSQGRQRAFLQGNLKTPRHLWVVCGGNGTVALDWSDWLLEHAPDEDAWLLVDFPGYGDCEGSPSPARIRETFRTGLPVAFREIGWESAKPGRLRFFGHSLGSAACLIASSEFGIQRGVLISPFTSTMEMSRVVTGLPLGFLVTHRFDNEARLDELVARGPGKVIILHGTDDEVIPISMGRELAESHPGTVQLKEIQGGRHNTIQSEHTEIVRNALHGAGR
jgi:uncharacterized protein